MAAGETYFFRAQGLNGTAGFFTLAIDYLVPPANDDFADAIDLGRTADVRSESTTYGATVEASEPETSRPSTIWWRWQAPESGVWDLYSFDDADLDVFRGSTLADLEEVHRSVGVERTAFIAVADEVYYLRMGVTLGDSEVLALQRGTQLVGDGRADAIDLGSALPAEGRGGLVGASVEPGEGSPDFTRSIWWKWRAPASGRFSVWRRGAEKVEVYRGEPADDWGDLAPVALAYNDYGETIFEAEAGDGYLVSLLARPAQHGDRGAGFVEVGIRRHAFLPGDFFSEAHELGNVASLEFAAPAVGASYEFDDPSHVQADDGGTIWMRWTAPTSGEYFVTADTVFGGDDYQNLGVYRGDALAELVPLAEVSGDGVPARASFEAVAGTTYHIAYEDEDAYDLLALRLGPASAYDSWAHQRVVEGLPFADSGRLDIPSGDGVPNLIKFALGLDPRVPLWLDRNAGRFPQLVVGPDMMELRYEVADGVGAVHYGEFSTDAARWGRIGPESLGGRRYVVRVPIDLGPGLLRFGVDP